MTLSTERVLAVAAELRRRKLESGGETDADRAARQGADRMMADMGDHPAQHAAIWDKALLTANQCSRRAGKSMAWLRRMAYDVVNVPGSHQIYINTTWPECRRIAWRGANPKDGLAALNRTYRLGLISNKGDHSFTNPRNGAVIELVPADNERAIERALGGAYHRIWIDEAQKMPHVQLLVQEVVGPAMMDFGGQIVMTGTPSKYAVGFYYDVVRAGSEMVSKDGGPGWSVHRWTVLDNPHFGETSEERFDRVIQAYCDEHHLELSDPKVRRWWFNEWVTDDAGFVWSLNKMGDSAFYADMHWMDTEPDLDRNLDKIPRPDIDKCLADLPTINGEWLYVLALDLGFRPDPFAWVIWAFSFVHPNMYELASWKSPGLTTNARDVEIKRLRDRLPFFAVSADAGPETVAGWNETWQERYDVGIVAATKAEKAVHMELMDGDIREGTILFRRGSPLAHEMRHLIYRQGLGPGQLVVDKHRRLTTGVVPGDHCCDGGLYGYRECYHHRWKAPVAKPRPGTPEYDAMVEAQIERTLDLPPDPEDDEYGGLYTYH